MASSGRKVYRIDGDNAIVGNSPDYTYAVRLARLTRPELVRAYALRFEGIPSGMPINCKNAELIDAIRTGVAPESAFKPSTRLGLITARQFGYLTDLHNEGWAPNPPRRDMTFAEAHAAITAAEKARDDRRGNNNPWGNEGDNRGNDGGHRGPEGFPGPVPPDAPIPAEILDRLSAVESAVEMVTDTLGNHGATLDTLSARIDRLAEVVENIRPRVIRIERRPRDFHEIKTHEHDIYPDVMLLAMERKNIFLTGPPGTGKSTIAKHVARDLGLAFGDISFGPMTPESKLNGFLDAQGRVTCPIFRQLWVNGGVFCGDEIDNGNSAIITTLNTALANGHCSFPDGTFDKHPDFIFIATGNTNGMGPTPDFNGRNKLDNATLDRFWELRVDIDETLEETTALSLWNNPMAEEWLNFVRRYRRAAVELDVRGIYFTPRAVFDGIDVLAAGMEWAKVVKYRLLKSIDPATVAAMEARF